MWGKGGVGGVEELTQPDTIHPRIINSKVTASALPHSRSIAAHFVNRVQKVLQSEGQMYSIWGHALLWVVSLTLPRILIRLFDDHQA